MDNKLITVKEENTFDRIKKFFCNLFNKKTKIETDKTVKKYEAKNNIQFITNGQIIELQRQYRNGKLDVGELSSEQVLKMCKLYDTQIAGLKRMNESKKKKILKYKESL